MGYFKKQENALVWGFNGEEVKIVPWGKNSLRVRASVFHPIVDTDYALLPAQALPAVITLGEGKASITNGAITATVTNDHWNGDCRIEFFNQKGEAVLREISRHGSLQLKPRDFKAMLGGDHRLTVGFDANAGEKLYGMGQYQQEILDLKGCTLELAQRNSQASVPFVLSSKGYGFLWHNPAVGRASFGANRTEWVAESTRQMDYWITVGETPAEIVQSYATATGTVPMMPEYGLGFWQCKLRYWNQEQLLEVARAYKRRGLPIDVIICDFFHWPKTGDFRFDEEFFPDPAAMARELNEMGIELMVSVWPLVALDSENFAEMREKGYLVRTERGVNVNLPFGGDSVFYDPTNPEARGYVWEKCKKNYYNVGVRTFWLDVAEPEYGVYDFDNYRYKMGPNLQIGNIFPQQYSRTFYEGLQAEGHKEIVNLVRCAWAGSQRYGALVWSGDIHSTYADLRSQICAGVHMGIAGIPWWTTDIGGFSDGEVEDESFRELLVRWFQYGAFCPVMRLHGNRLPERPLYRKNGAEMVWTGSDNEVWSFGEKVNAILEKYMRMRETMRPYTRSLMLEAHENGTPVMRAMFYEFPQDAPCWDLKDQYMFGPDLLVAPIVTAGALNRDVYLPAGARWTEASSGKCLEGGRTVTANAPLDVIPVFLRDGRQADMMGLLRTMQ